MSNRSDLSLLRRQAKALGSHIPERATRKEAEDILQRARDRRTQARLDLGETPNELVWEASKSTRSAWARYINFERDGARITELMRAAHLRIGCIVEHAGRAKILYTIDMENTKLWLSDLETGESDSANFLTFDPKNVVTGLAHKALFTPSPGYDPPIVALRREPDEKTGHYRDRTSRLLPKIAAALQEDEQYRHELYGVFWLKAAAERIATELLAKRTKTGTASSELHGREPLSSQRRKYGNLAGFCLYCSAPMQLARQEICFICEKRSTKPKTRFCVLCRTQLPEIEKNRKRYIRICYNH